ncbi:MAG: MFS transporter [Myxococcota bacterium]
MNYGQLRLFGSAAFIVASNVGGWILEHHSEDDVLQTLRYGTVLVVLAVIAMPRRGPQAKPTDAGRGKPSKSHVAFLVTTGFLHASHAMLYAFGTAHWRAIGIGDTTIGQLWSVGVLAEIGLFAIGGLAQRRLGSAGLLSIAAVAGIARWPLLSVATTPGSLFAVQLLHAGTFAALHLGAIAYVQERVDDRATATVTTLYSAASGVGTGLMMLGVGSLYDLWGGSTYVLMAALSGAGLIGAWLVGRASKRLDASD